MSESLGLALELMGVGMVTVFIILLLVVWLGNAIVFFVNRFLPAAEVVRKSSGSSVSSSTAAAIVAAVKAVTNGQGDVVSIERK